MGQKGSTEQSRIKNILSNHAGLQKRFFERFWMNLSSPLTVPYLEAKGRLYTTGKVIQRLFIIDLYT